MVFFFFSELLNFDRSAKEIFELSKIMKIEYLNIIAGSNDK